MPDFLALDWDSHQLSGLDATATRQGVTVRKAVALRWPENLDPLEQTEQAAHWLKTELARSGITTRNVLLSIPRESVVVRRFTVPHAPDDELPALVQMQAATKSSTPLDQLQLDFIPQPLVSPDAGREVLMCTITRKKTAQLRAILEGAGLEVSSVGISGIATVELIAHEERNRKLNPAEASLIISRHGHRVEISILKDEHVIFTHSTQIHADDEHPWGDESVIVSEVQRSLVSLHPQSGPVTIARAWFLGNADEVSVLMEAVEKRLRCETITLDPMQTAGLTNQDAEWPKPKAAFVGPVGLLLARSEQLVGGIDFQNPRKQRVRRDVEKIKKMAIAGALAFVFLVAMGYRWWKVQDLKNEIEDKRSQIVELSNRIKAGKPTMESAELIAGWKQKAQQEMGQIGQLHSALPGTDLMYLKKYRLLPGTRDSLGAIQAVGNAKDEADVRELFGKLSKRGIKVKPYDTKESTDSDYPVEFTLDMTIPLPAKPSAKKPS